MDQELKDFSMNFKETVLTILKDSMLYKTRQSLFIPRHSRTFKEHINPEYNIQSTNIVEFAKIQFGLNIGGAGWVLTLLPWIHHCNFSEGQKKNYVCPDRN